MESNTPEFSTPPTAVPSGNQRVMAIASLVLGVINLCAWFLPICGIPLSITGAVLGFLGMKDPSQKTMAIGGIALNVLGFLAACINAAVGVYLQMSGSGFEIPQF